VERRLLFYGFTCLKRGQTISNGICLGFSAGFLFLLADPLPILQLIFAAEKRWKNPRDPHESPHENPHPHPQWNPHHGRFACSVQSPSFQLKALGCNGLTTAGLFIVVVCLVFEYPTRRKGF